MGKQLSIYDQEHLRYVYGGMEYVRKDGKWIADFGVIRIWGVRHLVKNGTVVCNPKLNHAPWDHGPAADICEECANLNGGYL